MDKIAIELMTKYPALNTAKYGFENDIESLIQSTPNFDVYKSYPLSPSYMLPTPYVTLCDAISRAITQFGSNKAILEVQLRSTVLTILNPNIQVFNEIYDKYLTDIPKYFSHLLKCEWNDENELWSFKHHIYDTDNLLFKIRCIFEEFDKNYTLLNTKQQQKNYKQVKVPVHSFQQKWDLKYGDNAFNENNVEHLMFNHPFIYVVQDESYIWQMKDQQLSNVHNALLLHLSELYANTNKCHLNEFQDLYATIYGHTCVQLDMYTYLNKLGFVINPETLIIELQPCYHYHIPLPMKALSKISYTNLSTFGEEIGCKLLNKDDIDPYDSSASEINIASSLHRNLNGLFLKLLPLTPLPTNDMIDAWINRLCSKHLGDDIVPISMNRGQVSVLDHFLTISNQDPNDEHLKKIKRIMTLFEGKDKTWYDKLVESLPRATSQQSVTFANIKDVLPFQNEQQLLNEILFDPLCLKTINVFKDKHSNTYRYSLNEEIDETDIKSNVSTELILQNIISMNPQGMHLSEIKRYFPFNKLQLSPYHSLIDWFQHRFAAYTSFDDNAFITWNNVEQFNQMMKSLNLAEMPKHFCVSRENTLNGLLFVDTTSVLPLLDSQSMSIPGYLNSLCQYINNVSINLPSLPSSVPYDITENYDWLYNSFQIAYRTPSSSNILQQNNRTIPLKYVTQQILDNYQQQISQYTKGTTEQQPDSNPEKLSMHSISKHMPLCLFASKLYDKLLSLTASLSIYLPLFRNLDHFLKLYGFQITKPAFSTSNDFQLIHIKQTQEALYSVSMPINVTALYDKLSNSDITTISEDDLTLDSDDIRYILNFCHRDIRMDYKENTKHFRFRAPLSFPQNHSDRISVISKIYKRESQIDDIGAILQTMKRNEKYMLLSQFINTFNEKYNYLIPIEPLVHTLSTESNRYTKPIMTELNGGDYFIALDEESSLGARFESIFMDNNVDALTMPELKSLWFKKFSQQHPYPDGSLFTLINQFSNKFVLSTNYTLSLLNPHHKFSFKVKSVLNSLQTHNTQLIDVDDIIRKWNTVYTQTWHDNDTINLYLLPFISISHPDSYHTKPMIAFDTNFIDIFSDISGKWNLNMIERLDTMVKQILLSSQSKTVPLSHFQSKFLSFSGYIFPQSSNLIESLRQLPSITVDTSATTALKAEIASNQKPDEATFRDPVIRLREHVNINESALSETLILSEFDRVFQEKELISMNLSNFNRYYCQIFGKKFFQDISESVGTQKSSFYQLIKKTYNIWQIQQNSDGNTMDWLIIIQRNIHNPLHKTTFYYLTNVILSEISKSHNKKLYENELPQILPNSHHFKSKYLNNPNQIYPFDQYSNTAYFLMYNSPHQIAVQYDSPSSNQPFFTMRPKKFGNQSTVKSIVSSYTSLEEIIQDITANMNGDTMRLCDFQTLLFDTLPETTNWQWIFNKFPPSISSFINVNYSKLDRYITFENTDHLHQKANNYIKTMKPNDCKIRENIMQQFYTLRQNKISLQSLSETLDMKWPLLLHKVINVYSLDFKVSTNKTQQSDAMTLTNPDNILIHHPAFSTLNRMSNYPKYATQRKAKGIEQGLVLLALKYKDENIAIHNIQQILYALTEGNMLYSSNLMQSLQILGLGRIKLSSNKEQSNSFTIPTISIKGWQNELEQSIMNAFVSSLPMENTSSLPYLPFITESALQYYLASQFVKNASNTKVFRALTDSLWADLYTDVHIDNVDNFELRFSLRPITKHWNAEEGRQIDTLLNTAPEKVMNVSELQYKFYEKHNTFIEGEQSKRALSEFLSSKAKYCVLPLKNGDYLFSFTTYSKNLLRYFVRNIFKDVDDSKGFALEQIQTQVENNCDLNRLKQLKIVKSSESILPFPINNHVLMDICSDLIFPYYAVQPSSQNPIPSIIFRNRKKTNVASNVRDVIELYQKENNIKFISFSELQILLNETYPTYYTELEQNELFQTIASFPWLRFHLKKNVGNDSNIYDWNIEITLNANDIQHMRNDVSCEIFAALQNRDGCTDEKEIDEDGRMYRNMKGNNDLTMKAATFQNKFSGLTGLFYNPSYQSVTHYLLQISYNTRKFPSTLPDMDQDNKMKQLFASRFFGVRLSEINELFHENNYFEFAWSLPRILRYDPNITFIQVPYGPPDFFVVHSELNTISENDIIIRLQEIFKKQRMHRSNTESVSLLTESQIRSEWKSMFGRDIPFAYSMDLYHAFSHHFNDYITVHSFGNNKMFSMNDVQLLYNITPPILSSQFAESNQAIAKFVQKDQLSQQRKKILLSDAIKKISNDINYKSAEELLYELYESQLESSTALIMNTHDVVNVTFSQLFRNVLQPLKLEIGRSQSIDWLSYLMFRFNGYLSLLPQSVPDLQFSLQKMSVLKEKCEWIKGSRINPMVNFNVYEREHILVSLTQNEEEEMSLKDLNCELGEYFLSSHGQNLHHHIVRTLSSDIDIQHNMDKRIKAIPKHSKMDEKWNEKYDEFTLSLRSSPPQLRFCDIFEPVSQMLRRLDLSHHKICGMNEIQNQFYMLFGTYIPSTNLKATLMRYAAICTKPESATGFENVKMSQSFIQKTQNDIVVDAIVDYIRAKLMQNMHDRDEWIQFDEIMAYLNTLHIDLGDKTRLFEDIIHYLIDKRSLDFMLELDHEAIKQNENENHSNPRKTKWKIKLRPLISETNGKVTKEELSDLINNNKNNGAIKLSLLQIQLFDKYHKIIETSPRTEFSLYSAIVDLFGSDESINITPCGADSIIYTDKMSMYREVVRYALSYYCAGLRTHQLRSIIQTLLKPRSEYKQFSTQKLDPSKDISAIHQILSNCCFSFSQIVRDAQTGVYLISPFNIDTILAYKIRKVIDELSIKQCLYYDADGVLLQDVKQELMKQNEWNTKTHEFLLSAPFLTIKRDFSSNIIRISCLDCTEMDAQRDVILHHIVCENVLKCNTYNLQDMYCAVTGNLLDLITDHHEKILKEHSLKELLMKSNLRLHHDPQSRENLILPKTTIVRLKKPWLTRDKQIHLRHALNQLAKQYRIRYADFVEEFVLEVPTFIATSTFFIHGSGLSSVLSPKDLDLIIKHITSVTNMDEQKQGLELEEKYNLRFYSNYKTKYRNARSDLDMTIHGENFAIMMGLDCAHLLRLTFFRGTIRSFLRRLSTNNIRLSQVQELYCKYMHGSRWWSSNIADELRRLNCVLYADGHGDFMCDISHLRPMYDDKSVRGDLSFKIM